MCRLTGAELETLGSFLFGARWQRALAREITVDVSLVRRWKSGARPVSERAALRVLDVVRLRHARRVAALETRFAAMIGSLSPTTRLTMLRRDEAAAPPGASPPAAP